LNPQPNAEGVAEARQHTCGPVDAHMAMHSSANLDHSPCSSKTKLVRIEFSDLHVSKEGSVKPWCDQLESQLFEAKYFADIALGFPLSAVFTNIRLVIAFSSGRRLQMLHVSLASIRGSL
jgi:hypothetical protein